MTDLAAPFREYLRPLLLQDAQAIPWWITAAVDAFRLGHVQWIPSRDGTELYLARFWLTTPRPSEEDGTWRWESGESVLLHWFRRGDDDHALHDHPWRFTSDVLSGGYSERSPTSAWSMLAPNGAKPNGPHWSATALTERRAGGPRIHRRAIDLHAAEDVLPDTWTLVVTGQRERPWGFWPPGEPWIPWREFLARTATPAAPTAT